MIIYFNDTNNITKSHIFFKKDINVCCLQCLEKSHFFFTREKGHILVYIFRDLVIWDLVGTWDSSWGYWFLVEGLKWSFSTFILISMTHLTELFNVRD